MSNSDWDIKGRSHTCTASGREFSEGEIFHTLLFREPGGFRREDLCAEEWEKRNDNIRPFSSWKSKYEAPPPPRPEPLKKDDAEGLLRQMLGSTNPAYRNAQYILAIMLERKRLLRPLPSDDADVLVYERVKTGEVFVIPNPGLTLDQIPMVQKEVAELLEGGMAS